MKSSTISEDFIKRLRILVFEEIVSRNLIKNWWRKQTGDSFIFNYMAQLYNLISKLFLRTNRPRSAEEIRQRYGTIIVLINVKLTISLHEYSKQLHQFKSAKSFF